MKMNIKLGTRHLTQYKFFSFAMYLFLQVVTVRLDGSKLLVHFSCCLFVSVDLKNRNR